ncbi:MAG TPA: aminotransferase class III-fold pyridoxal phosphate-dependent enzyme, partial [Spirochaetia bacterium]|nr:aminotransferase class III-fold pyridoxal phosphate-dependent enzyme [Spirochaetia bacterium]
GFGPFPGGFVIIPFGDARALQKAITPNTAGFLVEPIQGEGGINVPEEGYLAAIRKICSDKNVCLVFDEIQTGLGRTGTLLAEEHEHVKADLTIIGKSLGGGFLPVSAVLARGDLLDVFGPGEHGSTFGGNPLACAVGRSALRVIAEEGLVENSRKMGAHLKKQIEGLESPHVKSVRGRGLMLGIELNESAPTADALSKKLIESGLLCIPAGERIVRFTPPIILDEEQSGWALERLAKVLTSRR